MPRRVRPGPGNDGEPQAPGDLDALENHLPVLGVRERRRLAGGAAGHDPGHPAGGLVTDVVGQPLDLDGRAVGGERGDEGRVGPLKGFHHVPPDTNPPNEAASLSETSGELVHEPAPFASKA